MPASCIITRFVASRFARSYSLPRTSIQHEKDILLISILCQSCEPHAGAIAESKKKTLSILSTTSRISSISKARKSTRDTKFNRPQARKMLASSLSDPHKVRLHQPKPVHRPYPFSAGLALYSRLEAWSRRTLEG